MPRIETWPIGYEISFNNEKVFTKVLASNFYSFTSTIDKNFQKLLKILRIANKIV